MSKRFYSFNSTEPSKKKSANVFLPWSKEDNIPISVKNGDIKAGISYLLNLNMKHCLPVLKVVFKHQLYSVADNRTVVDRGINALLETGDIKLFKTSLGNEQLCLMFTQDYTDHVKSIYTIAAKHSTKSSGSQSLSSQNTSKIVLRFIDMVLPRLKDISINESVLVTQHGFKDSEVTELIKAGILTVKNAGTWWLSIPNVGVFMKLLRKGRQTVIQTIKRTKYKEINRDALTKKALPSLKLNIEYQVHDLVGADLVKCIHSTTGVLLRLSDI